MEQFTYEGKPLYSLEPVHKLPLDEQLDEINKRMEALYEWSYGNNIVTKTHIALVLGFANASDTYSQWKSLYRIDRSHPDYEKLSLRAELLRRWETLFEAACIDKTSTDAVPARSIFLSKSVYGYWDTPQNKEENKLSIEVLIKRRDELKKKAEKEKKKKEK